MRLRVIWIVLIVCAVLMQSCGTFKKVFKLRDSSRVQAKSEVKIDSSRTVVDRSVTTITEKADTVVSTKEAVVREATFLNMDSLVNGMMAIKNDLVDVRLTLDPSTGILSAVATVKPQSVHVVLDKKTTIAADVKEDIRVAKMKNESLDTKTSHSITERKPDYFAIAIGIGVFVLAVFLGIYLFKKFK